jgi:hypothetical protein
MHSRQAGRQAGRYIEQGTYHLSLGMGPHDSARGGRNWNCNWNWNCTAARIRIWRTSHCTTLLCLYLCSDCSASLSLSLKFSIRVRSLLCTVALELEFLDYLHLSNLYYYYYYYIHEIVTDKPVSRGIQFDSDRLDDKISLYIYGSAVALVAAVMYVNCY